MALPVSGKSVSGDMVSHDSTVAKLIKFDARCECDMGEPVVATVMTCPAVAVTPNTKFKDVVNALLAGDAYAVPVVDTEARPLGTVTEADLLANLEFHGGTDAVPIFGGAAARRRWRKASALTAAELMAAPVAVIGADAPIGQAARRLSDPSHLQLCVVDHDMRLVGILTRRNLLTVYRRSDDRIEADVTAAIQADLRRPGRTPAAITVHVDHGVVTLQGTLTYRSSADHAGYAASRVAGVVAIRNNLRYEVDDLMITGL
jgi:CBS domain-containing protein